MTQANAGPLLVSHQLVMFRPVVIPVVLLAGICAAAQARAPAGGPASPKLDARRQFVVDVVRSATSMAQADPQDRLRVLTAAAQVIAPLDPVMAKQFAREGAQLEGELIAHGQVPVASMFASGHVDCGLAVQFVESVPAQLVLQAQQSLLGIVSSCGRTALSPVRRKLEAGLDEGAIAPRALLAVMERSGMTSGASQAQFARIFASLPSDAEKYRAQAPEYATLLARMARVVDKDALRDAGVKFLEWLGNIRDGKERNLAVNMTADALREGLGEAAYKDVLAGNVMARQVAETAGAAGEVERPPESVSVLAAMKDVGKDQTDRLTTLAPALRAREAAAHGFASGNAGDLKSAERYFDISFSAAEDVWNNRASQKDAAAVVQEVSEAVAQVDPVTALKRAQALSDPAAQAISMLAVARVVLGKPNLRPMSTAAVRK